MLKSDTKFTFPVKQTLKKISSLKFLPNVKEKIKSPLKNILLNSSFKYRSSMPLRYYLGLFKLKVRVNLMKIYNYCVYCGAKLLKKSKNCPQCGKNLKNAYFLNKHTLSYIDYIKKRQKYELNCVETLLNEDEKLFFHSTHSEHVLRDIKGSIFLGALLESIYLFFMIIGYYINSLSTELSRADTIGYIIMILTLSSFFLYPLIKDVYKYYLIIKHYTIPHSELRDYIEASFLTNKRWVQKSLETYKNIYTLYPLERKNDILFTEPKNIHLRYFHIESNSARYVKIETFLNPSEKAPEPLQVGTAFMEPETFKTILIEMKKKMEMKLFPINKLMGAIHFKETY